MTGTTGTSSSLWRGVTSAHAQKRARTFFIAQQQLRSLWIYHRPWCLSLSDVLHFARYKEARMPYQSLVVLGEWRLRHKKTIFCPWVVLLESNESTRDFFNTNFSQWCEMRIVERKATNGLSIISYGRTCRIVYICCFRKETAGKIRQERTENTSCFSLGLS
jgi:hypothetical protein